jgi:hypothetical protein
MRPLTQDIYDALGREIERIEGKRGAWLGDDAERVELCTQWRAQMDKGEPLILKIESEKPRWPIRL